MKKYNKDYYISCYYNDLIDNNKQYKSTITKEEINKGYIRLFKDVEVEINYNGIWVLILIDNYFDFDSSLFKFLDKIVLEDISETFDIPLNKIDIVNEQSNQMKEWEDAYDNEYEGYDPLDDAKQQYMQSLVEEEHEKEQEKQIQYHTFLEVYDDYGDDLYDSHSEDESPISYGFHQHIFNYNSDDPDENYYN
jgi:hypothetical protein